MNLNIQAGFYLVTGGAISSLVLLVGHYFPWHKLLGEELSRVWAYCYGSLACWVAFSYWRYFGLGDYASPIGLMFIYIVSGLTVRGAYWLDEKGQERTRRRRQQSDKFDNPAGKFDSPTDELSTVKEQSTLYDQR